VGNFREDLLFRINTVEIHLPALRDRREDIPLLALRISFPTHSHALPQASHRLLGFSHAADDAVRVARERARV
jgi:DNA-binding NtrC family response regulator